MIYCVIPEELEAELYDRLVEHYKDNPNVEVIVDRRSGPDRRRDGNAPAGSARSATGAAAHPGHVPRHRVARVAPASDVIVRSSFGSLADSRTNVGELRRLPG